jgi:hypothetical protein
MAGKATGSVAGHAIGAGNVGTQPAGHGHEGCG